MATQLKIMSFNMRLDAANDGINNFEFRKPRILEYLREQKADIIGFQEIRPTMRAWLVENFPEYYMVGIGRGKNYDDETSLIAFRKDKMALISCDTIMLSNCPTKFGSTYEASGQSPCPREYVRALIKHHDIAEPFYMYNVHTDYASPIPRILASAQMLQDITAHDKKFFLSGDFNAVPGTTEINMLTECTVRGIKDATDGMDPTCHLFGTVKPEKIDYIFCDADTPVLEAVRFDDVPVDGVYVSDHNPIYIIAEL